MSPEMITNGIQKRAGGHGAIRMNEHSRWFINDEEVGILKHHLNRNRLGDKGGMWNWVGGHFDDVSFSQSVFQSELPAVDKHETIGHGPSECDSTGLRILPGEKIFEPHAARLVGHPEHLVDRILTHGALAESIIQSAWMARRRRPVRMSLEEN